MNDPGEPQWDLLPDQPEQFFSLTGEYDVRDLKRSYNALIRRFKPEKFPEEFQRIRAAYERLNDALRYGETSQSNTLPPQTQFDWSAPPAPKQQDHDLPEDQATLPPAGSPAEAANEESAPLIDFPELHERVKQESLPELYEELASLPHKTPYDYYALALLSDLQPEEAGSFPLWLLKGLKAHPEEPALFELLHQYFLTDQSTEGLGKLLVQTSRIVRNDRFYYLTENAWDRLLRDVPFSQFRQVLEACETNLLDHEVDHLLVFYVHLLKAALWKADPAWIHRTFAQIDEYHERMSYWLEQEYEFLFLIRSYQEQREEFLNGGPVRKLIDQSIIDYCTQNEPTGDRRFLECQQALVSQRDELLEEFAVPSRGCENAVYLWETIAADVSQRIATDWLPDDPATLREQTFHLAGQLFAEREGAEYRKAVKIPTLAFALIFLLSMIVALLLLINKPDSISGSLLIVGCLLLFNGVAFIISVVVADMVTREFYLSWWRRQLMTFYQSHWFPLPYLAAELKRLNGAPIGKHRFKGLGEVANMVHNDAGLWFYSTAQRLMTACR